MKRKEVNHRVQQPLTAQLPSQFSSMPPPSQLTSHGAPLVPHVTLQVVPVSQVISQPPIGQSIVQSEPLSQSNEQSPPLHV